MCAHLRAPARNASRCDRAHLHPDPRAGWHAQRFVEHAQLSSRTCTSSPISAPPRETPLTVIVPTYIHIRAHNLGTSISFSARALPPALESPAPPRSVLTWSQPATTPTTTPTRAGSEHFTPTNFSAEHFVTSRNANLRSTMISPHQIRQPKFLRHSRCRARPKIIG